MPRAQGRKRRAWGLIEASCQRVDGQPWSTAAGSPGPLRPRSPTDDTIVLGRGEDAQRAWEGGAGLGGWQGEVARETSLSWGPRKGKGPLERSRGDKVTGTELNKGDSRCGDIALVTPTGTEGPHRASGMAPLAERSPPASPHRPSASLPTPGAHAERSIPLLSLDIELL